jgi:glutamyl endopeptidase
LRLERNAKRSKERKEGKLMKTIISFISLIGLLFNFAITPAKSAEFDPLDQHTPVSSEGVIGISPAAGPALRGVNGFEGIALRGEADDSLANFPALWETPAEYSLLLQSRDPMSLPVGRETLLGDDIRSRFYTTIYPHRAMGLISFSQAGANFRCTGWLISPNTVATAGHCVHTGGPNGSWSTNVVFYPGRDGVTSPYGSCTATTLFSVTGWTNSSLETTDYGAIKLNCNIGNTVGWFGWWWQTDSLNDEHAAIAGYPGDKPLDQWGSFGVITATETRQLFYFNDTVGGMSGSPVYQPDRRGSFCQGVCAMAIHAYGTHGSGNHATQNHATRIVEAVSNNFFAWVAAP